MVFSGCPANKPVTVIAPVGPAVAAVKPATDATLVEKNSQLSRVSASAGVIEDVNATQPPGAATEGVKNEAGLIKAIAGPSSPEDEAKALQRKNTVLSGDLSKIKDLYVTANTEARAQKDRADKAEAALRDAQAAAATEQAANAEKLKAQIKAINDAADARVQAVKDEERKAWMRQLNWVLLGLGSLLILTSVANAWLTSGTGLAKSGILAGGAALCFGLDYVLNSQWFVYVAIGSVILTVLGVGIWAYLEYKAHLKDKAALTVDTAAQKVVKTLDAAYESATPEAKALLDPVFATLGNDMDAAEKAAIHALRFKANVASTTIPKTK